ncbi:MAG: TetR family transcriptional regulator [Pseudomonadota bacterium]
MDPRKKKKYETRQRLMSVAADSLASGRSFDTLSLREVAKLAGIPPTSFYRHFHDLDALGFALIEEHRKALLALMETVRREVADGQTVIRASVEAIYEFIFANQGVARMIVQESMSLESPFREASESLFLEMASDLSNYLEQDAAERQVPVAYPKLAANAMLSIMFTTGIALLNASVIDRERHINAAVIKVRMILHGAEALAAR